MGLTGLDPGSESGSIRSDSVMTTPVEPVNPVRANGIDITRVTSVRMSFGRIDSLEASLIIDEMERRVVRVKLEIKNIRR